MLYQSSNKKVLPRIVDNKVSINRKASIRVKDKLFKFFLFGFLNLLVVNSFKLKKIVRTNKIIAKLIIIIIKKIIVITIAAKLIKRKYFFFFSKC